MEKPHVQVRATSLFLRNALEGFLRNSLDDGVVIDHAEPLTSGPGDVVVTVDSCCPPEACRRLAQVTRAVIVLAAVPRSDAADLYYRSGAAAYLPMDVTGESLIKALNSVLSPSLGE
ncbi:MAG: hypothetical protein C0506_09890 [Anaerolinea sp.]|nr:hypothetical protein [Anaerolinea sp.]